MLLFPFGEIVSEIFYWLVMALDNLVFRASLNRIQGMTSRRAKSERVLFFFLLIHMYTLDILFPSNHNIHKSLCGLCFGASDALIDRF